MRKFQPFRRHLFAALAVLLLSATLPAYAFFDRDTPESEAASLPIAENLDLTTYRDVAISDAMSAVDPEGDPVTFRITKNPARGQVVQAEEGGAQFTYTPYEGKVGKDSFVYVAEDSQGNVSRPALVSIRISKADTKVTYADMSGHPAHKAAIALAEREVFVGEQVGETWLFRPEAQVSREEFLAMAMDLVDVDTLPQITRTGFADDDSISVWAKPYVASALHAGMIQGSLSGSEGACFSPARAITPTEAAVMLDRLLGISDVAATGSLPQDAAPAWAYQSVVNVEAVGILETAGGSISDLNAPLNRGQAAELLLSAMDVLNFRAQVW